MLRAAEGKHIQEAPGCLSIYLPLQAEISQPRRWDANFSPRTAQKSNAGARGGGAGTDPVLWEAEGAQPGLTLQEN